MSHSDEEGLVVSDELFPLSPVQTKRREVYLETNHIVLEGEPLEETFFLAFVQKSFEMAYYYDSEGYDVASATYKGISLLMKAVEYNNPEAVKFFLERGANSELVNENGMSPLALLLPNNETMFDMSDDEEEENEEENTSQSEREFTYEGQNNNVAILHMLVEAGVNINKPLAHINLTSLVFTFVKALSEGLFPDYPLVSAYLSHFADAGGRTHDGATLLMLTCSLPVFTYEGLQEKKRLVDQLLNISTCSNVRALDDEGRNVLIYLCESLTAIPRFNPNTAEYGANSGYLGDEDLLQQILYTGIEVNHQANDGSTALGALLSSKPYRFLCRPRHNNITNTVADPTENIKTVVNLVDILCKAGADMNLVDESGYSPLMYLCEDSHLDDGEECGDSTPSENDASVAILRKLLTYNLEPLSTDSNSTHKAFEIAKKSHSPHPGLISVFSEYQTTSVSEKNTPPTDSFGGNTETNADDSKSNVKVYSSAELMLGGEGEDTSNCPVNCDCCY